MNPEIFSSRLLQWYHQGSHRPMPWRGEKDPYKIWLSEVILQQTRVGQGLEYYNRFVEHYPDVRNLAQAKDDQVFKLWEGLGYYSRCRNLLATAREISEKFDGQFPNTFKSLLKLKGIGPYTASAIASFAFNLPHAVVDGNVQRILSRVFGIRTPIDSTPGKKEFQELADKLLDARVPGTYNQAIMDFGATLCKPQAPLCSSCPFAAECFALHHNLIQDLPVKSKKMIRRERWFHYYVLEAEEKTCIRLREEKDIWQGLHQPWLWESQQPPDAEKDFIPEVIAQAIQKHKGRILTVTDTRKQILSHQDIYCTFTHIQFQAAFPLEGYQWVTPEEVKKMAFPRIIRDYLNEKK